MNSRRRSSRPCSRSFPWASSAKVRLLGLDPWTGGRDRIRTGPRTASWTKGHLRPRQILTWRGFPPPAIHSGLATFPVGEPGCRPRGVSPWPRCPFKARSRRVAVRHRVHQRPLSPGALPCPSVPAAGEQGPAASSQPQTARSPRPAAPRSSFTPGRAGASESTATGRPKSCASKPRAIPAARSTRRTWPCCR
jgi:hypothetical protein